MSEPSDDVQVKVATEAAGNFVESYYPALNNMKHGRSSLTSFYVTPVPGSPLQADISLNGNIVADPADLQAIFEKQVARAHYEVQSFDCHVLNTNFNVGAEDRMLGPDKDGRKMSILVIVSGSVKYWKDGAEGDLRGFTETVVLVPNWAALGSKAAKGEKKWLIQSQNFRLVL